MKHRHSHILMNGEDQEGLPVKVWAKLDNPFLSYDFCEVLVNPYYGHLEVSNSARICDVIAHNSPLAMYIAVHLKKKLSWFFQKWCRIDVYSHVILKKYTGGNIIFDEKEKKSETLCT